MKNASNPVRWDVALQALIAGARVAKVGWKEGTFVFKQVPASIDVDTIVPKMQSLPESVKAEFIHRLEDGAEVYPNVDPSLFETINYVNQFAYVTIDNQITGFFTPVSSPNGKEEWYILDQY